MSKRVKKRHSPEQIIKKLREADTLLTFYDFPAEHWIHLRTTGHRPQVDPIESVFSTVKHRQKKTRGNGSRTACLAMVSELTESASK